MIYRQPFGVVAIISPWNYPFSALGFAYINRTICRQWGDFKAIRVEFAYW
jgi:hypothetical protein